MSVIPELKRPLYSLALVPPAVPPDPEDCAVLIEATIGPAGAPGEEGFSFTAITPRALARDGQRRWGRGYLLVPRFSWDDVEVAVRKLLQHSSRGSWSEVARCLSRELRWEFDDDQESA